MTLKKLSITPGINQEATRYSNEGRWWTGDKVRFRQGQAESIGGWSRIGEASFEGTARHLYGWVTLSGVPITAVGTHSKYYVFSAEEFVDITPLRDTATLTNPFAATAGSQLVTVTDVSHGAAAGDYVAFSGATGLGGTITSTVLNAEYQISEVLSADSYTIDVGVAANATDASGSPGGGTVTAAYQISPGGQYQASPIGWGAGGWGVSGWGYGVGASVAVRTWTASNFGQDLIFAPSRGAIYYWDVTTLGSAGRAVRLDSRSGASDVPNLVGRVLVSDVSRFVFAFGCSELGDTGLDMMLVRWSDQENSTMWTPSVENQAGGLRLSQGSEIVSAAQLRQEVLVWTDTALYSMQYQGPPYVWGATLVGESISIVSANAVATAANTAFWMGIGVFYMYSGNVTPLACDLRQYVFQDFNYGQQSQVFAGTLESYSEIWWFYPSTNSTVPDKYVCYNYRENLWMAGNLVRYAWIDRGVTYAYPLATTEDALVQHEFGLDDNATGTPAPIHSYIESCEFDLDDGDKFVFIRRMLPDITFRGSTSGAPTATMTLYPMKNSGSGFGGSVGGTQEADVVQGVAVPVEEYTGQVFVRVRGRQMVLRVESNELGTAWQLGTPRIDMRPDGGRG